MDIELVPVTSMDTSILKSNSVPDLNCSKDALEAVKQDPAILEVQINNDENTRPALDLENFTLLQEKRKSTGEKIKELSKPSNFEEIMRMQKAALLSLAPQQFELLLKYANTLRMQRLSNQKHLECGFCKNNGERTSWYSSHMLKDGQGRVRCPVLRMYRCPLCDATGDHAHTIKYCPKNLYRDYCWGR